MSDVAYVAGGNPMVTPVVALSALTLVRLQLLCSSGSHHGAGAGFYSVRREDSAGRED